MCYDISSFEISGVCDSNIMSEKEEVRSRFPRRGTDVSTLKRESKIYSLMNSQHKTCNPALGIAIVKHEPYLSHNLELYQTTSESIVVSPNIT